MGRIGWFVAGTGVGILAASRLRRPAGVLSADDLRDRAHAVSVGLKQARQSAAQARVDREIELRDALDHDRSTSTGPTSTGPTSTAATPSRSGSILEGTS